MSDAFALARDCFFAGNGHFEAGRYAEAERAFEASLRAWPGRVSTLANLAAARIRLGRAAEALAPLDEALATAPDDLDAWSHKGHALAALGRDAEALACFDRALVGDPQRVADRLGRGTALNVLQRHAEALEAFAAVLVAEPDRAEAWYRHGQTLQAQGRDAEALPLYERALALDPAHGPAWSNRGGLLRDAGRHDEAALAYEQAIGLGADVALNRWFLASVRGGEVPARPPEAYVAALFDGYAQRFDEHLVGALGYQAHAVLAAGLAALDRPRFGSALDLGCGTGLCGPLVAPQADRLVGVDLSAGMLAQARALGVYDALHGAELVAYLARSDERHDLVVAADVFIYVGDLEQVFAGIDRVLKPGGTFAFSVELASGDRDVDCELRPSLRYAHSEAGVRRLAAAHGLRVEQLLRRPIRHEQQRPVIGLFAYLLRP